MSASASEGDDNTARIARLERQLVALKAMLCLVLAGVAAIAYLARGVDGDLVQAERLELHDHEGRPRLVLTGESGAGLTILDEAGGIRARLHLDANERPGLFLHGNKADIGIAFNESDLPAIEMRFAGRPRLTLGLAPAGGALLLHGPDGEPRLSLQSGESVDSLNFGPDRLRLETDDAGAAIQLQSSAGSIRMASTPGQSPGINTVDSSNSEN